MPGPWQPPSRQIPIEADRAFHIFRGYWQVKRLVSTGQLYVEFEVVVLNFLRRRTEGP